MLCTLIETIVSHVIVSQEVITLKCNDRFAEKIVGALVLVFLALSVYPTSTRAEWIDDGIPVTTQWTTDPNQIHHRMIDDGHGGFIVVWCQFEEGVFAQRIDDEGIRRWGEDTGMLVRSKDTSRRPMFPYASLSWSDRVIVVWQEETLGTGESDIRAQLIDVETGTLQWADARLVCNASGQQYNPRVTDEQVVVWLDRRDGYSYVYGQRLGGSGNRIWDAGGGDYNGIKLCSYKSAEARFQATAVPDFEDYTYNDGVLVTYTTIFTTFVGGQYCQRYVVICQWVTLSGDLPWGTEGFVVMHPDVCKAYFNPVVIKDPQYPRVYIACEAEIDPSETAINVAALRQEYGYDQEVLWRREVSGLTKNADDGNPQIAMAGYDIIVTWERQEGSSIDIYARKLNRSGSMYWGGAGYGWQLCGGDGTQNQHQLVSASGNTAIVTWCDYQYPAKDIYARMIKTVNDTFPVIISDPTDELVCGAANIQEIPRIARDDVGGAFLTWADYRDNGQDVRVYAQHFEGLKRACTIHNPSGGELIASAGNREISLEVEHVAGASIQSYEISLSYDGGLNYIPQSYTPPIEHIDDGRKVLNWNVDATASNECLLRVLVSYSDGTIGEDESDSFFSMYESSCDWVNKNGVLVPPPEDKIGDQANPHIISGGQGTFIITWEHKADTLSHRYDIYAKKVDVYGNEIWTTPVCTNSYNQNQHQVTTDGAGGVIVTWKDTRRMDGFRDDIYAQRIDASGNPTWAVDGILIRAYEMRYQVHPVIASDGSGGAIIGWIEEYPGFKLLYLQRVSAAGAPQWGSGGKNIYGVNSSSVEYQITSDTQGGCYVAYTPADGYLTIFLRRYDHNGVNVEDKTVMVDEGYLYNHQHRHFQLIPDYAGGTIITWEGKIWPEWNDIRAQRIFIGDDQEERRWWIENGIVVSSADGMRYWPKIIPDGAGGAIITWHDERNAGDADIYAQRVDIDGEIQWLENGVPVCNADGNQIYPEIVSMGSGGSIILWNDDSASEHALYAQKLHSNGLNLWSSNGILVMGSLDYSAGNYVTHAMCHDDEGGILFAWEDRRGFFPSDLYAQRIEGNASAPRCDVDALVIWNDTEWEPADTSAVGCPHGDFEGCLFKVMCDFNDADMEGVVSIPPEDIILETDNLGFSFCDPSDLDTAGTVENGYTVTLIRKHINGCSDCQGGGCSEEDKLPQDIPVYYGGFCIDMIQSVRMKSLDVTNDGRVNLSDYYLFTQTYNKQPDDPAFNSCCDFNLDGYVNLSDFSLFVPHYLHYCDMSAAFPLLAAIEQSNVIVRFNFKEESDNERQSRVHVTVSLENAGNVSTAVLGLNNDLSCLDYIEWKSSPTFTNASNVVPIERDGKEILFIGVSGMKGRGNSPVEIGTIEYAVAGHGSPSGRIGASPIDEWEFTIAFGEVLDMEGKIREIAGVEHETETPVYSDYLGNNYPNPFNPTTTILFSLAAESRVDLSIYNVNGQRVRTLTNGIKHCGVHRIEWDGTDDEGRHVASGVYFYQIKTDRFTGSKKLIVLR